MQYTRPFRVLGRVVGPTPLEDLLAGIYQWPDVTPCAPATADEPTSSARRWYYEDAANNSVRINYPTSKYTKFARFWALIPSPPWLMFSGSIRKLQLAA